MGGADYQTDALAATALIWNMRVCSTLWAGPLADELDMDTDMRAEHQHRRAIHFRRIVDAALSMRSTVSRTLEFTEVFVDNDAALMPRGVYFQAALRWPHMFPTLSPTYLGLAQAAYDFTIRYLHGGVQGAPPGKGRGNAVKQHVVAEMRIKIEQVKTLWFQVASEARVDPAPEQRLRAYAAQFSTMETANNLATLAIRTCDGPRCCAPWR